MAKKTDTSKQTEISAAPAAGKEAGKKPKKAAAADPAKKTASAKPATAKRGAAKAAKPAEPKAQPASAKAAGTGISMEDIALRAYYLGETRLKLGLPGDSAQDWIEAERQLVAEAQAKN